MLRLFYFQIIEHEKFELSGKKNFLRMKVIPAQRGNILDCNGIALATNQPITKLIWKGSGNIHLSNEQEKALNKIYSILQKEPVSKGLIQRAEKYSLDVTIAQRISQEELSQIAEQCSDIENIHFTTSFHRFYPYNKVASHLLGYLGDLSESAQGKMGLEKICQETLQGDPAILMQSTNSFGSLLDSQELKQGNAGEDIVTSIDLDIQLMLEKTLEQEEAGSCIIFEPKTGYIKALVSKPNFDPSIFSEKLDDEQWQELQKNKVFLNRAFNATYPPASIFKLVTISAALEEKIISQDSRFFCAGYTNFKGRDYHCNNHTGHGYVSTEDSLALSCNIPFFEIAKKIHIDTLADYAFKFGLGNKTNIPFSEQTGLIPTNKWKLKNKGERWWTGENLSACIGQSFLLVTPIQIACMIGAIFHGNLIKPRILIHQPIEKTPITIQPQTRQFLQLCMRSASRFGTAKRTNKIGNLIIFAKTGTAQTKTRKTSEVPQEAKNKDDKEHAWFVSYFYTENSEPLVMVMLLEHVGKSIYTAKVAVKFLIQYNEWIEKKTITQGNGPF
ncbi:hypothetical protein HYV10_02485 [Candidatus Dependentiae bacterium]|nr:hypothetical protein [Candidatus Dependentiae bacterium]